MAEKSRIKFNPTTKEIEIEGSEAFVKKYFDRIQTILTGQLVEIKNAGNRESGKSRKSIQKTLKSEKPVRETKTQAIINLIVKSRKGVSTANLNAATGYDQQQIWNIISKASKEGKIIKVGRGIYRGA